MPYGINYAQSYKSVPISSFKTIAKIIKLIRVGDVGHEVTFFRRLLKDFQISSDKWRRNQESVKTIEKASVAGKRIP